MKSEISPKQNEAVFFGRAIRRHRFQLGISQEELADRASLHRTYISDVELGLRNPSLQSIVKLARAFNLPVATLFSETGAEDASDRFVEILLIEDNPRDVELTLRALWKAKVSNVVNVARDGEEALSWLFPKGKSPAHRLPGIVLLDLSLPKVSGLEILHRMRADEQTRKIPVVVLAESNRDFDFAECQRLGVKNYLVKPFGFRDFSDITPELNLVWTLQQPLARG